MAEEKREPWNPLLCNYPNSRKINSVSLGAETLFTRLIAASDDGGNYDGSHTLLACKLYADRMENKTASTRKVRAWRQELLVAGLCVLYKANRAEYIHILNVKKILRSDVKRDIRFPGFNPQLSINTRLPASEPDTARARNECGPLGEGEGEGEGASKEKENKHIYAEFVLLTTEEYGKLCQEYGKAGADDWIEELDDAIGSRGYRYKSHYRTIRVWAKRREKEKAEKDKASTHRRRCTVCGEPGTKYKVVAGEEIWRCPKHPHDPPKSKAPQLYEPKPIPPARDRQAEKVKQLKRAKEM